MLLTITGFGLARNPLCVKVITMAALLNIFIWGAEEKHTLFIDIL